MTALEVYPTIIGLDTRNVAAEAVIRRYARRHALIDGTSGALLSTVPFGNAVALAGQLTHQLTVTYPAMVRDLAGIYRSQPDHWTSRTALAATAVEGLLDGILAELTSEVVGALLTDLQNELVSGLAQDVIGELLAEASAGIAASFIPVLGIAAGAAVDVSVAWVMTWRMGAMTSTYFQNGGFVGDRKATWKLMSTLVNFRQTYDELQTWFRANGVKRREAAPAPTFEGLLGEIRHKVPPVMSSLLSYACESISQLKEITDDWSKIEQALRSRNLPEDVLAAAIARMRAAA